MTKPIIGIGADIRRIEGEKREGVFAFIKYVEAVRLAGGIPVIIPPQPGNIPELLDNLDGVILAGGPDCDPLIYATGRHEKVVLMDTRRQENDLALAKSAREADIPTLGICLGAQIINVAAGGTLVQHIESDITHATSPDNRGRHDVTIERGTRLHEILGGISWNVNSSHHQSVETPGDGLRVTSYAPDGIVEGVEDPQRTFYVGVQWHPEDMTPEESSKRLFGAFVEAARKRAEERRKRS